MISVKRAAGTLRTSDIKDKVKSCCHCESAFPVAETSSDNVTTAASTFLLCLSVTEASGSVFLSAVALCRTAELRFVLYHFMTTQ